MNAGADAEAFAIRDAVFGSAQGVHTPSPDHIVARALLRPVVELVPTATPDARRYCGCARVNPAGGRSAMGALVPSHDTPWAPSSRVATARPHSSRAGREPSTAVVVSTLI